MKPRRLPFILRARLPLILLCLAIWQIAYAQQGTSFRLAWDDPPSPYPADRIGFRVYRGTAPGQTTLILANLIPAPPFVDTAVQRGTRYYYAVSALYADGLESQKSNQVTGLIPAGGGCN